MSFNVCPTASYPRISGASTSPLTKSYFFKEIHEG
jgi:hypothetical protein